MHAHSIALTTKNNCQIPLVLRSKFWWHRYVSLSILSSRKVLIVLSLSKHSQCTYRKHIVKSHLVIPINHHPRALRAKHNPSRVRRIFVTLLLSTSFIQNLSKVCCTIRSILACSDTSCGRTTLSHTSFSVSKTSTSITNGPSGRIPIQPLDIRS